MSEEHKLDMFTLNKVFDLVSDLEIKNFEQWENKIEFARGRDDAYRTVLGQLSGLIEHRKILK